MPEPTRPEGPDGVGRPEPEETYDPAAPPTAERPTADATTEARTDAFDQDTVEPPAATTVPADDPAEGGEVAQGPERPALSLAFHAVSDVGRVRKDNQDSGYAGPWLLAVCDGVGGAARGDIASGTAIGELRQLDESPGTIDLIDRVNDGLHEAHVAIGVQVDQDPSLSGTSTTATVALFDGNRLALGHVGDSRAYLLRDGELSQLTVDHTFVQSLIDEGRITEAEARVHPHRNLILKALDGMHDADPDVFALELNAGDRLFLCSDGACGVLDDDRITQILSDGSPEFSAVEMVRASLDAGSSDNVTCVVADVSSSDAVTPAEPQVVGAAADLRQRRPRTLFRGHRSGDTGELEPIDAEIPEGIDYVIQADPPLDSEAMRYAPQPPPRFIWARRLLALAVLVGLAWMVLSAAYWWSQKQYYLGEQDGEVVLFQGVDVPGLSDVIWSPGLDLDDLSQADQRGVRNGIDVDGVEEARDKVEALLAQGGEDDGSSIVPDDEATAPSTDSELSDFATDDPSPDTFTPGTGN